MSYSIDREIARFARLAGATADAVTLEPLCEHGVLVTPRRGGLVRAPAKRVALTLMGITHGNESAGLAVINQLLAQLVSGVVHLRIPVALLLGNPPASLAGKRFLDRDLNRSFNRGKSQLREERRALELEAVLRETAYFVDYHQVTRRSGRPFFIFPYQPKSFAFARAIGPRHTVVTHWGKPFSAEGMCSDEYVNSFGGTGISFELGQNGFDAYQIAVGVEAGLQAIRAVTEQLERGSFGDPLGLDGEECGDLFTWAEIVPWPEGSYVELRAEWNNFDVVGLGETVGLVDGVPLTARHAGRMLFPKYLTREEQKALASRPTELFRIMREIAVSELPAASG
jgi:predicted deacylase